MSSNRLIYDTCAYKKSLEESVSPYYYAMYPGKYENCSKCRIELGVVGGNNVSLFAGNLVDLESDLRGQNRPASMCPKYKYTPDCKSSCKPSNDGLPCRVQPKMVNLPTCQMVRYPPVVLPGAQPISQCSYRK
jgi:hypothetical protein